ncbi:hypothetical protein L596_026755 [Steinernema carpocapsae]|uniref:Uncharacterized protein n=1 Tax=Steinernema carpocapsae TaxID=34508 RepID=A0A4U5M2B3_STECR|nr:hypothetical protein L596_026755 [Steinernema carpocapsae]
MTAIGCCDSLAMVVQIYLGIRVAVRSNMSHSLDPSTLSKKAPVSENVILSFINSIMLSAVFMYPVLAFNRLIVITDFVRLPSWVYIVSMGMALSYTPIYVFLVIGLSGGTFFWDALMAPIIMPALINLIYVRIETYLTYFAYGSCLIIYVLIFVYLISQRLKMTIFQTKQMLKQEVVLLLQSFLTFACGLILLILSMIPSTMQSYKEIAWRNFFVILYSGGLNPLIYLVTNSELRSVIKNPRLMFKQKSSVVAFVSKKSSSNKAVSPLFVKRTKYKSSSPSRGTPEAHAGSSASLQSAAVKFAAAPPAKPHASTTVSQLQAKGSA